MDNYTRSSLREDIVDFTGLYLRNMPLVAKAYVRLMTWKMNERAGLPKTAFYQYPTAIP